MNVLQPARCVATITLAMLASSGSTTWARDAHPQEPLHHRTAHTLHSVVARGASNGPSGRTSGGPASDPLADLAYDSPLRTTAAPFLLTGIDEKSLVQNASFRTVGPSGPTIQTGLASWYGGRRWQGNRTSDGGRYDENELTAAHASLPLGSHVRVTLVGTNQSVVVRITDRPGTRRRIIDLSRAAAAALGMLDRGLATVALQPL